MSGWFAMKRDLFAHPIFHKQPQRVAVWAWMLATAAWKDTKQDAGGKIVTVKRGQLLTSYRQMSDATGVGVQVIRTLLKLLENEHAINTATNTGRMLITICNYERYQSPGDKANTAPKAEPTQSQHTKEQGNNKQPPPSEEAELPEPYPVSFITKTAWAEGKRYLERFGISNPGSMIGRWLKTATPLELMSAIEAAQKCGTEDPVPYITQALKRSDQPQVDLDAIFSKLDQGANG